MLYKFTPSHKVIIGNYYNLMFIDYKSYKYEGISDLQTGQIFFNSIHISKQSE